MKKLWMRILAIAMLAVMLPAAVSCGGDKTPAKTDAPTKTETPDNSAEKPEDTKPPVKERDVPFVDRTEDDTVNDNF